MALISFARDFTRSWICAPVNNTSATSGWTARSLAWDMDQEMRGTKRRRQQRFGGVMVGSPETRGKPRSQEQASLEATSPRARPRWGLASWLLNSPLCFILASRPLAPIDLGG